MPVPTKSMWRMLVLDTHVQLKVSDFFSAKDDMVEPMCEKLAMLIQHGVCVTNWKISQENRK